MSSIERLAIEIIAGLLLVWGTVAYLEHRGAAKCYAAEAQVVAKAETRNTQVETAGKVANAQAETKYDDTISQPLAPVPALPSSLSAQACPSAMPSPRRVTVASDYRPTIRAPETPSLVPPSWSEFERSDVQDGRDADAEVIYLQTLLANQYAVCTGRVK